MYRFQSHFRCSQEAATKDMWYEVKGYTALSERRFNYHSFGVFCSLLVVVGILNVFSPSDGIHGNMFSALYYKFANVENNTQNKLAIPFTMEVELVEPVGTYGVLLNVTLSDTGGITCVVAPSNFTGQNITDLGFYGNTAYYRANVPSVDLFLVTFLPNIEQRLFCQGYSISNGPKSEATYVSDPFYVSYMSWNIEIIRRNFYSTTLEILNGNVTLVKDPVIYPDVNMTVLCHLEPVVKEKGYLRRTDEVFDTTLSGFFPLNFTYDNRYRFRDVRVDCSRSNWDSVKKEFVVPEDHQKSIIIPGLTILDLFHVSSYMSHTLLQFFSIDYWYPIFKENTVKTRFIRVQQEFVDYILSDGVVLPTNTDISYDDPRKCRPIELSSDSDEAEIEEEEVPITFLDLENEIQEVIDEFGGDCFVRTNWSSAKDAFWITGSLKCTTPGHVFLLLKSSDRISSDYQLIKQSPFYEPLIVLQRWCNYYPSMEFCLYIGGGKLRAISQRDTSVFYPFLVEKRDELASLLKAFVNEIVLPYFSVDQFEMDVYIDKKQKVWVVNINALDDGMNPGLFTLTLFLFV
ncbi:cell division cycle protein [Blastocystis sp. subtype 4]|uniref:cell division cycle protein n=1 Tax=Blastocystis sp. subtype 4 TaxID=944170 RepID=UPI0007118CED|nr:cell division cycle protein [Blastocystis sp. subtype 4]KNB45968.1 cell division cycle protein [Blastocystis sp. subtype 4]|eukprot:XP_014529411.1 cell division cycle protein [Blastocystis sp. subtype 4]